MGRESMVLLEKERELKVKGKAICIKFQLLM